METIKETERDNCRRIAEWLFGDVFCSCLSDNDGYSIHGYCRNNKGFESRQGIGHCWSCNKRPMYYDFYRDESANNLLLDAAPDPQLWMESMKDESRMWGYMPDLEQTTLVAYNADRKTAVVEGSLRFIEAGGKKR